MMRLASGGADADELAEDFAAMAEDFAEYFPEDIPVLPEEVPGIVDEVVAEYQRVVTTMSPDAAGLMAALDHLLDAGILYSYGDGFDDEDAMEYLEDAFEFMASQGGRLRGYLYSTVQDLDRLVLAQRLEVSFGTFDADRGAVAQLAQDAVALFRSDGLQASWSGDIEDPIVIEPMVVDAPLVATGEDEHDHDHDHAHHDDYGHGVGPHAPHDH